MYVCVYKKYSPQTTEGEREALPPTPHSNSRGVFPGGAPCKSVSGFLNHAGARHKSSLLPEAAQDRWQYPLAASAGGGKRPEGGVVSPAIIIRPRPSWEAPRAPAPHPISCNIDQGERIL